MSPGIECAVLATLTRDFPTLAPANRAEALHAPKPRCGRGRGQTYLSAIVFGDSATEVATLVKGERVYLEGRVEISEWVGRDGEKKTGLKITSFFARPPHIGRRKPPRAKDTAPAQSWSGTTMRGTPRPGFTMTTCQHVGGVS